MFEKQFIWLVFCGLVCFNQKPLVGRQVCLVFRSENSSIKGEKK